MTRIVRAFATGLANEIYLDGKISRDFRPYFYVCGDESTVDDALSRAEKHVEALHYRKCRGLRMYVWDSERRRYVESRHDVYLVRVSKPSEVPKVREIALRSGLHVAESAVPYSVRVSVDHNRHISIIDVDIEKTAREVLSNDVKILAFDMEVRQSTGEVLIGVADSEDNVRYFKSIDEFEEWLYSTGERYYALVGYNVLDYDFPILAKSGKCRLLKFSRRYVLQVGDLYIPVIDLYKFVESGFRTSLGLKSTIARALDDVAAELGVITSEERRIERASARILREWKIEEVKLYLTTDLRLTLRIGKRWLKVLMFLAAITGLTPESVHYVASLGASPGKIAEAIILTELEREGHLVEDRQRCPDLDYGLDEAESGRKGFPDPVFREGRKVLTPRVTGIFCNVVELDFDALYPSIYYCYRLGPVSTYGGEGSRCIRTRSGIVWFNVGKPTRGDLAMFKFFEIRTVTKKLKKAGMPEPDIAAKILANASYGFLTRSVGIGLVNELVSGEIFQRSTYMLHIVAALSPYPVLYGDTDSLHIWARGVDPEKVESEVNRLVKTVFGDVFNMKLEEVWDICVFFAGVDKNYIKIKLGDEPLVVTKGQVFNPELPQALEEHFTDIILEVVHARLTGRRVNIQTLVEKYLGDSVEGWLIRKTRRLGDYVDEEEGRLKRVDRRFTLAAPLIAYAVSRHYAGGEQDVRLVLTREELSTELQNYIVSAVGLKDPEDHSTFYMLDESSGRLLYVKVRDVYTERLGERESIVLKLRIVPVPESDLRKVRRKVVQYVLSLSAFEYLRRLLSPSQCKIFS